MLFIKLLASALAGFGLHQFYRPSAALGPRWGSLLRYAIGAFGLLPFLILINRQIANPHVDARSNGGDDERLTVAYMITVISFGAGTMAGHLLDRANGE